MSHYKFIYGPVDSWRLGSSLGIDPISTQCKTCTFDCVYCQLGSAPARGFRRKVFVPTKDILRELESLPAVKIDYITFSGTGEPTLAQNLDKLIGAVRRVRKEKIAVFTNSTLLGNRFVRRALAKADLVEAKLDAPVNRVFKSINKPYEGFSLYKVINGIKVFKDGYKGKFALQIMFTQHNIGYAKKLADIARSINPDEVHINTPLRPSGVRPVPRAAINKAKKLFKGLRVITVYDSKKAAGSKPISAMETLKRRGKV
ncbi:MAG: radical SAM protein [Candidatus Omnitrophota bacterium]|jgi:wyosine [tRNA(Phe)-imidazoG37] synthetase (radical SAM superfamily)